MTAVSSGGVVERVARARTMLFVPGTRPDRFAKAVGSGADVVLLDLEDAVAPADKETARDAVTRWLDDHGPATGDAAVVGVRLNASGTEWHDADVEALAGRARVVMVPKAEDPQVLTDLSARLGTAALVALVETSRGIVDAPAVAAATGIARLAFGSLDLATELGVAFDDHEAMAAARGALVLASAAAGLTPPVDGVTQDVGDEARLRDDLAYAVRLGFAGKLCVHPRQVGVAAAALAPSAEELAWAARVLDAAGAGGVVTVDGRMVDKPVVDRARRVLEEGARTAPGHTETDADASEET